MKLPEGWSEAEVLRCAAEILDRAGCLSAADDAGMVAQEFDYNQKLAAPAAPDDQGEKEAGGDSVLKEGFMEVKNGMD